MVGVVKLFAILAIFTATSQSKRRRGELIYHWTQRVGGLIHDWTQPLNAVLNDELLIEELWNNVDFLNREERKGEPNNIFYSTNCKEHWSDECANKITKLLDLISYSKGKIIDERDVFLLLTFPVDVRVPSALENWKSKKHLLVPTKEFLAFVTLPPTIKCEELENVTDSDWETLISPRDSLNGARAVGFGYSEELIGCNNLEAVIKNAYYLMTSMTFGETPFAPESFSVFSQRLLFLHDANTAFVKKVSGQKFKDPSMDYYITSTTKQEEAKGRRNRLNKYAQEIMHLEKMGIIAPLPLNESESELTSQYPNSVSIIPYVNAESCDYNNNNPFWYAPTALEAISQHFDTMLLTHREWKRLNAVETINLFSKIRNETIKIKLDIIIDYSYMLLNQSCDYNWTVIERELRQSLNHPVWLMGLKALIFPVENQYQGAKNYHEFSASTGILIGCSFEPNEFETLGEFETTANSVVKACEKISRSLYSLQFNMFLLPNSNKDQHNLYFEIVLREKLENIKKLQSHILKLNPLATVYIHISVTGPDYSEPTTAFCNKNVLSLNNHIEAILNFAQFNNISLILGQAFNYQTNHQNFQSWLSIIAPETYYRKRIADYHPSFALRNYPQNTNNWEIDPCIDWMEAPPIIERNYFWNNNVGTIFDPTFLRYTPISQEEYETLLKFILNRFDLVTILVGLNWENVINALSELALKNQIGQIKNILLDFKLDPVPEDEIEKQLFEFNAFLERLKILFPSSVNGVHFDLEALQYLTQNNYEWNLPLSFKPSLNDTLIKNEALLAEWRKLNLKMGLYLPVSHCVKYIWESAVVESQHQHTINLLLEASYLVCHYDSDFLQFDSKDNLGALFDTHLYIKREFERYHPHLDLYFHINLKKKLEVVPSTMNTYLILLSHFKQLGSAYNISYLIVSAFESKFFDEKSGWWNIKNYSDLADTSEFVEKYSDYLGAETWRPQPPLVETDSVIEEDFQYTVWVLSLISGILLICVILGTFLFIRSRNNRTILSTDEVKRFLNGRSQSAPETADADDFPHKIEDMNFNSDYELSILDISIDTQSLLGFGNFGTVHKGLAKGKPAAIKRPNKGCLKAAFKTILCEVKILSYIGTHPNVVEFLGAYVKEINKGILCIATEYCSNGSLESVLRKSKGIIGGALRLYDLHRFGKEIAKGMEYIGGKKVVHGDLSARNVLLDENLTCKISDFGLSRKLYEYEIYVKKSQEALPWKWMAYESLTKREFTVKSDVWSYGVTLWEIFSLGNTPYGERNCATGFVEELRTGERLPAPQFAIKEIYLKLQECWNMDAEQRPSFADLSEFFNILCRNQYDLLQDSVDTP